MPQLLPATELSRQAQALEVFRIVEEKRVTVKEACEEVGITPGQYYRWISKSTDAIDAIKDLIFTHEREAIVNIAIARAIAIRRITESIDDTTNVPMLMQVESFLRTIQKDIEERHGISSMDKTASDFLLTGPVTSAQPSRTTIHIDQDSSGDITLNITKQPEIIDMRAEDSNEG